MSAAEKIDIKRLRRNFGGHADEYDRYARVQKRVVERLVQHISENGPVSGLALDIGTGTGMLAKRLVQATPSLEPVVCDIAHGMTRFAASQFSKALALDADAQHLPLRSGCFDLVVSSSVYQWVNNLPQAFGESSRVLKGGGLFAFAMFGEKTLFELKSSHREAVEQIGGNYPSHVQTFPSEAQVRSALDESGFANVRLFSEDEVERHPDVATLLRSLKGIGAMNATYNRPPGLASRRIMNRMMALYNQQFGLQGHIPATYHVIFGLANRLP